MFYVADVELDWKFSHDALHGCLARDSVVAFFPMRGEKRYRIVGAFPEDMDRDEGEVLFEEIERRIKENAEIALDISHVNWFSTYKVHTRHVNKFSEGRCFLAGDAAHIHTPAGGQGMNTGIQDAYNWRGSCLTSSKATPADDSSTLTMRASPERQEADRDDRPNVQSRGRLGLVMNLIGRPCSRRWRSTFSPSTSLKSGSSLDFTNRHQLPRQFAERA